MGGRGSGAWCRWDKRATVEDFRRLDVRKLQRTGVLAQPGTVSWAWWDARTGEMTADIRLDVGRDQLTLRYRFRRSGEDWRDVTEPVPLDRTPCHFGGERPWFLCPGCGKRRAILYGGSLFRCRACYGVGYASQSETKYDRLLRRGHRIRLRLGGELGALNLFPLKPKGMHWRTYWRLRHEGVMAEEAGLSMAMARFATPSQLDGW